jgi:hypothetical protein
MKIIRTFQSPHWQSAPRSNSMEHALIFHCSSTVLTALISLVDLPCWTRSSRVLLYRKVSYVISSGKSLICYMLVLRLNQGPIYIHSNFACTTHNSSDPASDQNVLSLPSGTFPNFITIDTSIAGVIGPQNFNDRTSSINCVRSDWYGSVVFSSLMW